MDMKDAVETLQIRLLAQMIVTQALCRSHPDPTALLTAAEQCMAQGHASILLSTGARFGAEVSDSAALVVREVVHSILQSALNDPLQADDAETS